MKSTVNGRCSVSLLPSAEGSDHPALHGALSIKGSVLLLIFHSGPCHKDFSFGVSTGACNTGVLGLEKKNLLSDHHVQNLKISIDFSKFTKRDP